MISGVKNCSIEELRSCAAGETCEQIEVNSPLGVCHCLKDYYRATVSGLCVPDSQDTSQDFSNGVSGR